MSLNARCFNYFVLIRGIVVHAEIKPDNVLVGYCDGESRVRGVKLIDLGSAFSVAAPPSDATATPQYLPPKMPLDG